MTAIFISLSSFLVVAVVYTYAIFDYFGNERSEIRAQQEQQIEVIKSPVELHPPSTMASKLSPRLEVSTSPLETFTSTVTKSSYTLVPTLTDTPTPFITTTITVTSATTFTPTATISQTATNEIMMTPSVTSEPMATPTPPSTSDPTGTPAQSSTPESTSTSTADSKLTSIAWFNWSVRVGRELRE
jgi:hypothetical protein